MFKYAIMNLSFDRIMSLSNEYQSNSLPIVEKLLFNNDILILKNTYEWNIINNEYVVPTYKSYSKSSLIHYNSLLVNESIRMLIESINKHIFVFEYCYSTEFITMLITTYKKIEIINTSDIYFESKGTPFKMTKSKLYNLIVACLNIEQIILRIKYECNIYNNSINLNTVMNYFNIDLYSDEIETNLNSIQMIIN